jgi:Asp/Glu/hydantoin racemase
MGLVTLPRPPGLGDALGLLYPFPRDTGGRLQRHDEFWDAVSRHVGALEPPVLQAWPEAGGVPVRPDVADPAYGAGDLLPAVRDLASSCSRVGICDMYEPGLAEARAELGERVLGALEACLEAARRRNQRVGFVTARPGISEAFLRLRLRGYGLEPHSVHALRDFGYDLILDSTTGRDDALLEDFLTQAEACVRDGAGVIVPVCVFFGPMLARRGRLSVRGVEILEPIGVLVEAARRRAGRPSSSPVRRRRPGASTG